MFGENWKCLMASCNKVWNWKRKNENFCDKWPKLYAPTKLQHQQLEASLQQMSVCCVREVFSRVQTALQTFKRMCEFYCLNCVNNLRVTFSYNFLFTNKFPQINSENEKYFTHKILLPDICLLSKIKRFLFFSLALHNSNIPNVLWGKGGWSLMEIKLQISPWKDFVWSLKTVFSSFFMVHCVADGGRRESRLLHFWWHLNTLRDKFKHFSPDKRLEEACMKAKCFWDRRWAC